MELNYRHKAFLLAARFEVVRVGQTIFNTIDAGERASLTVELTREVTAELNRNGFFETYSATLNLASLSAFGADLVEKLYEAERREHALALLLRIGIASGFGTVRHVEINPIIRVMELSRVEALNYVEYLASLEPEPYVTPIRGSIADPAYFAAPSVEMTGPGVEAAMLEAVRVGTSLKAWYKLLDLANRWIPDKVLATVVLSVVGNLATTAFLVLLYWLFHRDFSQVAAYFGQAS